MTLLYGKAKGTLNVPFRQIAGSRARVFAVSIWKADKHEFTDSWDYTDSFSFKSGKL